MQVVAMQSGFYNGSRRRTGDVFEMDVPTKDGKPVLPKWVKAAPNAHEAKVEAAKAKKAEQDKLTAGAIAASGGKAAKEKSDAVAKQLAG
jgi:hypothetical protein